MTNTYPALTIDSLACAIASRHYSTITNMHPFAAFEPPMTDDIPAEFRSALQHYFADPHMTDDQIALLPITFDALTNFIADDLDDYAHNANHHEYTPLFFDLSTLDDDADPLFDIFTSYDLAKMIATILAPLIKL